MRLRHAIMIFLALLLVGQAAYYYPILPATMASHFDGSGNPDGWMAKSSFFAFELVIFGVMMVEFLGLPWLVERMPDSWINLPNKSYWLTPERRSRAFEIFRIYFQWFSIALLLVLVFVNQLVYRANLTRTAFDSSIWLILAAFFVFVIIWLVKFILVFRKPS
ncbi:MAG: DUF1648 domain-containing protein [Pyrinomonadaceae bacterium]